MTSASETATVLFVLLKRSGQKRARVSAKTIKILATRQHLRSAFVLELIDALAEFDWVLCELASGGYGAIQANALEAAKPVTAKRLLTEEERSALRRGDADFEAYEKESEAGVDSDEQTDE